MENTYACVNLRILGPCGKRFFRMVLMAICDARRCFTLIDVGEYGTNNDSCVLKNSQMGKMFQREEMNVPGPRDVEKKHKNTLLFGWR